MKSSLESRLFLLCIALLISVQGLFFAFAEETESEESLEETQADYACAQMLIDSGSAIVEGYEEFLNEFFKIDYATSNQVGDAMDFYRYVEDSMNDLYETVASVDSDGSKSTGFASAELTYCSLIRDQYIAYARALLQKHALASANSKTTFEVVDGLKVLNADLEDFSEAFLEVFPGAFNQMSNALPCYARQCITK